MEERCSGTPRGATPEQIRRKDFLKLGGAGLAGVTLIGGLTGTGRAVAQSAGGSSLRREFEAAAAEYGVPAEVLIAMGYVNTRWQMPEPAVNAYEQGAAEAKGTYGIMALVQNPTTDTLGDAAALTGLPEAQLKTDRASNIRGAAALLAEAAGVRVTAATQRFSDTMSSATDGLNALDPDSVERFTDDVTGAVDDLTAALDAVREGLNGGTAVAGVGGGELYEDQVRSALQSGVPASL